MKLSKVRKHKLYSIKANTAHHTPRKWFVRNYLIKCFLSVSNATPFAPFIVPGIYQRN